MTAGLPTRPAVAVHAEAGTYAYDTMTLVGPGTWEAARAAVDCAVTAADLVLAGERAAYALCRPPGHHATPAGFGGSCYLNNAAAAAEALRRGGHERVAVIDIDAHQGNGTAAIFYDRGDVLYGSVHVDPAAGWFPHIVGYADETGTGDGVGCTRNRPLPERTADGPWLEAIGELAEWVVAEGCSALVVSLGVDAAVDDPESPLMITARRLPVSRVGPGPERPAGRRRPGGRLPLADPRRPGHGVPGRTRHPMTTAASSRAARAGCSLLRVAPTTNVPSISRCSCSAARSGPAWPIASSSRTSRARIRRR